MSWILLAAAAQLILAVVALVDKFIVSDERALPKPFVYAFYTCLISGAWILVYVVGLIPLPWHFSSIPSFSNVEKPTLEIVALAFLAAYTFFLALVSMFNALKQADASDVVPVVGAVSALASFGLGYFFLGTQLSHNFIWGIVLLSLGTFLVSRLRFPLKVAALSIHAGLFFALHYVSIKGLFLMTTFDNGFFWSRVAFMLFALSLLLVPIYYEKIVVHTKAAGKSAGPLILLNKIIAGVATILVLKATDLGDVAVVQALGGLQFVFILILGLLFSHWFPQSLKSEGHGKAIILQRVLFVSIIALGFLVLFE
ncbi:EamA family transporter [Candidatus Kaiserbacteria bacterium]|nr:EamA family transporter [Candidatus Kaiserbacteria bacterium]